MNRKDFFSIFWLVIILMFIYIPASLPIEGGCVFIAMGILLLCIQIFRHSSFFISKSFVFFAIVLVYLFVYSFYGKPIPITIITLQRAIVYLLLALLAYTALRSDTNRRIWENALIVLAIFVSLVSLYEVLDWHWRYFNTTRFLQYVPKPQVAYRLSGYLFGHPNPLAGFLNFVWPLIFLRLYNSKKTKERVFWSVGLLIIGVAFIYTNSRGALLGTFVEVIFLFIVLMLSKGLGFKLRNVLESKRTKTGFFTGIAVLFTLFLSMLWRSVFTGQFGNRSFSGRGTIWKYSWQAVQENPIWGQGIGAFPVSYTRLAQLPPGDYAPSAHNLWLQLSVDYGIVGFAFICLLIGYFLFYSLRSLRVLGAQQDALLPNKYAYVAGGLAFLAQQTVDYMLVTATYLIFVLVILVLLFKDVVLVGEWELNRKSYIVLLGVIIGVLIVSLYSTSFQIVSFARSVEKKRLFAQRAWDDLEAVVCSDAETHSLNALYKFECSMSIAQQFLHENVAFAGSKATEMLDKAIYFQQGGYDLNPYWATQTANLGVLYWEDGNVSRALSLMKNAVSAAPTSDLFLLNLAWMEETLGYKEAAIDHYTRALRLNPLINLSEFAASSDLLPVAAEDLLIWGGADELWENWYDMERHDRGPQDFLYWKGIIGLSGGREDLAIEYFEESLASGSLQSGIILAYAYKLDGQPDKALAIAHDIVLLSNNEIIGIGSPLGLSIIASILRDNGEIDIAYDFLLDAFENANEKVFFRRYYPAIYAQQIVGSEISPLLIRNYDKMISTTADWEWFIEETRRRGDFELAAQVENWLINMAGIAR